VPIDVHHINQNNKDNRFQNLIALCPNDHARAHKGEIDRKALRLYKHNLALITGRYGDLERRVLDLFVEHHEVDYVTLPTGLEAMMSYMVHDGIVDLRVPANEVNTLRYPSFREYWLTDTGQPFVERLREGRAIE
jgi:hypothetical protein